MKTGYVDTLFQRRLQEIAKLGKRISDSAQGTLNYINDNPISQEDFRSWAQKYPAEARSIVAELPQEGEPTSSRPDSMRERTKMLADEVRELSNRMAAMECQVWKAEAQAPHEDAEGGGM